MPKCEIFDLFDFNDFYVIRSIEVGDLRADTDMWARYVPFYLC